MVQIQTGKFWSASKLANFGYRPKFARPSFSMLWFHNLEKTFCCQCQAGSIRVLVALNDPKTISAGFKRDQTMNSDLWRAESIALSFQHVRTLTFGGLNEAKIDMVA